MPFQFKPTVLKAVVLSLCWGLFGVLVNQVEGFFISVIILASPFEMVVVHSWVHEAVSSEPRPSSAVMLRAYLVSLVVLIMAAYPLLFGASISHLPVTIISGTTFCYIFLVLMEQSVYDHVGRLLAAWGLHAGLALAAVWLTDFVLPAGASKDFRLMTAIGVSFAVWHVLWGLSLAILLKTPAGKTAVE